MDINESDWRVFRSLHSIALERFYERVIEDVRKPAECKSNYHDCYRNVYRCEDLSRFHFRYCDFVYTTASQVKLVVRRGHHVAHHAAA
jgi:hypothetical protein